MYLDPVDGLYKAYFSYIKISASISGTQQSVQHEFVFHGFLLPFLVMQQMLSIILFTFSHETILKKWGTNNEDYPLYCLLDSLSNRAKWF